MTIDIHMTEVHQPKTRLPIGCILDDLVTGVQGNVETLVSRLGRGRQKTMSWGGAFFLGHSRPVNHEQNAHQKEQNNRQ